MTGVAGAFLMLGGMAAIAVIITTLDYLAERRDEGNAGPKSVHR
jgi:hypothetical protein